MLETLKFGGGNWANKTDSTLAYSDQYGNYKPLPFDFTRASSATRVNKQGLIESVNEGIARIDYSDSTQGALLLEPQRTNLITQSEAFGNSYWTKSGASIQGDPSTAGAEQVVNGDFSNGSTDWTLGVGHTVSGSKLNINGASFTYQSVQQTVSSGYRLSFSVSNYVSGTIRVYTGSGTASVRIDASSDGNFELDYIANGNTVYVQPTGGTFIGSIDNVSIKEVQGFASPSADSPLNAFKFVEDSANTYHYCRILDTAVSSGATVTLSMFSKKAENNYIALFEGKTAGTVFFNLNNGTIVSESGGATGTIELFSNNWYKISLTVTVPSTAANFEIYTSNDGTSLTYQGVNGNGTYIYGAQLEQASYPTSYIPTQGSTVTRVAELCSGAGNDQVINSTEGVLYAEISALDNPTSQEIALSVSEGQSGANRLLIRMKTNGAIGIVLRVANTTEAAIDSGVLNQLANHKVAVKWKVNDIALWIDGVEVGTDNLANVFPVNTLDEFSFNQGNNSNQFYGNTKDVRVYNTALTDGELATLKTL
jgi:hypothetical protein